MTHRKALAGIGGFAVASAAVVAAVAWPGDRHEAHRDAINRQLLPVALSDRSAFIPYDPDFGSGLYFRPVEPRSSFERATGDAVPVNASIRIGFYVNGGAGERAVRAWAVDGVGHVWILNAKTGALLADQSNAPDRDDV